MMKAVVINEFGGPNVLKVEQVRIPQVEKGKCVIKLHACGVNPVLQSIIYWNYNLVG